VCSVAIRWGDQDDQDSKYLLGYRPVAFKKRGTVLLIPVEKNVYFEYFSSSSYSITTRLNIASTRYFSVHKIFTTTGKKFLFFGANLKKEKDLYM
jgi:hypothetical protein